MPDSQSPNQPQKPSAPTPIPSPPLPPNFHPAANKPTASTPSTPVPSPPLPPIVSKTPPKSDPPEPPSGGFKLSGETPPATLTPEEAALRASSENVAQKTTQAPAPQSAPVKAAPHRPATPPAHAPRPGATPPRPGAASTPAVPVKTPAMPPLSGAHAEHVEEYSPPGFGANLRDWLDKLEPATMWVFRIGLFFGALSLAFLLYAIFVGKIGQPGTPAAMVGNIKVAASIFHWAVVLLALSTILLTFDATVLGVGLAIGGLILHFGAPWLFFNHIGQTDATLAIVTALRTTGSWLTTLGVLKLALDLVQWIMLLPERMKQRADVGVGRKAEAAQQRVARDANVFSPCWKLPFCRETIRKQCPAFLAKQTCWKFGRGCYCDEEMISRIIRGESLEVIKAPTRLSKTGKAPCGRCHIYLEHQGHKFRALSPLTLPATAIIMYMIWPFWTKLFAAFSNSPIWDMLSFDPKKLAPDAIASTEVATGGLPPEQVMYVATMLFGVLLGFFVLIYVAKFIEWFVYKAKL